MEGIYINNNLSVEIQIWCDGDWNIVFLVGDSFDYEARANRIAITRWLLATWKEIQVEYKGKTLYCDAYNDDGKGDYRLSIYQKLGFIKDGKYCMYIDL